MNAPTTFPTAARIPLIDPRDLTDVVFAVAAGVEFDRRADRLSADVAAYLARCDAALARTQEPTPC